MATPLVGRRGKPQSVRCDNGPDPTGRHFLSWCLERQIELVHIQPGKPTQNADVESFHGKLREDCLPASWFQNLFDVRRKFGARAVSTTNRGFWLGDARDTLSDNPDKNTKKVNKALEKMFKKYPPPAK